MPEKEKMYQDDPSIFKLKDHIRTVLRGLSSVINTNKYKNILRLQITHYLTAAELRQELIT